jgi:hypothetical protein
MLLVHLFQNVIVSVRTQICLSLRCEAPQSIQSLDEKVGTVVACHTLLLVCLEVPAHSSRDFVRSKSLYTPGWVFFSSSLA